MEYVPHNGSNTRNTGKNKYRVVRTSLNELAEYGLSGCGFFFSNVFWCFFNEELQHGVNLSLTN